MLLFYFLFDHLLDARAEIRECFCVELLGELKTPQFPSEISWPIASLMALALAFYTRGTPCIVYNLVFTHFHSAVSTPTPLVSSSGLSEPAPPPPDFDGSVNHISAGGTDYAHHITTGFQTFLPTRDYVRILILGGLLVIDCLFLFVFSFLNPQIPGG